MSPGLEAYLHRERGYGIIPYVPGGSAILYLVPQGDIIQNISGLCKLWLLIRKDSALSPLGAYYTEEFCISIRWAAKYKAATRKV